MPPALIALSAIPLTAGTLRIVQIAGGPPVMAADDRYAFSLPVVIHIVGAAVFALIGAFQFVPSLRRRHRGWHRRAGRVLVAAGLLVAGSALWMTLLYPYKSGTGDLLYLSRLLFGSAMLTCLVLGFGAVRRHDIARHRAWMIRGYALALGAGTQVFTEPLGATLLGTGVFAADLAKSAGWALNLAVAEWVIRRATPATRSRRRLTSRPAPTVAPPTGATP